MTPKQSSSLLRRDTLRPALVASLRKLDPRVQLRNPVMFVVEVGAVLTTIAVITQIITGDPLGGGNETLLFTITVTVWLWLTVVFANLAEALAEGRGRAQAATRRAWIAAFALEMCGSTPDAEVVTASAGTSAFFSPGVYGDSNAR